MRMTRHHLSIIEQFSRNDGYGELDRYGRILAGPNRDLMNGDTIAWMQLVSEGLVAGEFGRVLLTEAGRQAADNYLASQTKG